MNQVIMFTVFWQPHKVTTRPMRGIRETLAAVSVVVLLPAGNVDAAQPDVVPGPRVARRNHCIRRHMDHDGVTLPGRRTSPTGGDRATVPDRVRRYCPLQCSGCGHYSR